MTKSIKFTQLAVVAIGISGNNPRQINTECTDFKELLESIKADGVRVPIMVRPQPNKKKEKKTPFELIAGERRLLAAAAAELEGINCLLYENISDEEAFDLTFCENFARKDLTPLEESKAAVIMLKKYGGDVTAAASKLGKSISWLVKRAAINDKICDEAKEKLAEFEGDLRFWTASHIQQIAGLPDYIQIDVLNEFDYNGPAGIPTVQEVAGYVTELMRPISKAPWKPDSTGSITVKGKRKAVRCFNCPHTSRFQPGLFDDTLDAGELKKNNRCLDPNCWQLRMNEHLLLQAAELRKENPNLVYVSEKETPYEAKEKFKDTFGQVFCPTYGSNCKVLKKANKNTTPALVIDGPDAGTVKNLRIDTDATRSSAVSSTRPKDEKGNTIKKPLKERKAELDKKRWFAVLRNMIEAIGNSTIEDLQGVCKKDWIAVTVNLASFVGTDPHEVGEKSKRHYGEMPEIDKFIKVENGVLFESAKLLFELIRPNLQQIVTYNGPITQTPDEIIKQAKAIANLLKLNIDDMCKRAEKEYPEPKAWASE